MEILPCVQCCLLAFVVIVEEGQGLTKLCPSFVLTISRCNDVPNYKMEDNLIFCYYIKLVIRWCLAWKARKHTKRKSWISDKHSSQVQYITTKIVLKHYSNPMKKPQHENIVGKTVSSALINLSCANLYFMFFRFLMFCGIVGSYFWSS